jgi:hypothetical protein
MEIPSAVRAALPRRAPERLRLERSRDQRVAPPLRRARRLTTELGRPQQVDRSPDQKAEQAPPAGRRPTTETGLRQPAEPSLGQRALPGAARVPTPRFRSKLVLRGQHRLKCCPPTLFRAPLTLSKDASFPSKGRRVSQSSKLSGRNEIAVNWIWNSLGRESALWRN